MQKRGKSYSLLACTKETLAINRKILAIVPVVTSQSPKRIVRFTRLVDVVKNINVVKSIDLMAESCT